MLSCNAALLDGTSLAACLDGVGHLLTRRQIAAKLARDPTFLYQASRAGCCVGALLCRAARYAGEQLLPSLAMVERLLVVVPRASAAGLPQCTLDASAVSFMLLQFQPLEGQSRGERDAEYLADMYKAA